MIFDVARHKFSEGLITLMLFALVALIAALLAARVVAVEGGAPLQDVVQQFAINHSLLSSLLMFPTLVYSGLRFARAAVRIDLYSTSSLGLLALGGVAMFALTTSENYLSLMVIVLLTSELFGRLLYCFGPYKQVGYLFTAMLALGVMPLVDSSLIPFVLLLLLIVIVVRGSIRETIISLVGAMLPSFIYCYIAWLLGGEFGVAFNDIWSVAELQISSGTLLPYLTLPRLIFLGATLFLTVCSLIAYYGVRMSLSDSSRTIWRLLITVALMLVAMLVFIPSATPAMLVILTLVMTLMLPQLFIRIDVITATILYLIWVVLAVVTLF